MKTDNRPPPLVPAHIDGRLLGPPPRSLFVRCAMHDFGMTEAEADAWVDKGLKYAGIFDEVDHAR